MSGSNKDAGKKKDKKKKEENVVEVLKGDPLKVVLKPASVSPNVPMVDGEEEQVENFHKELKRIVAESVQLAVGEAFADFYELVESPMTKVEMFEKALKDIDEIKKQNSYNAFLLQEINRRVTYTEQLVSKHFHSEQDTLIGNFVGFVKQSMHENSGMLRNVTNVMEKVADLLEECKVQTLDATVTPQALIADHHQNAQLSRSSSEIKFNLN
jgi:hypothetical protein